LYWKFKLDRGARILSEFVTPSNERFPASYIYEQKDGTRLFVSCMDFYAAKSASQLIMNYARQTQWARALGWINRKALPAFVPGEPDVRVACRRSPDKNRTVIILQNLRLDPLVDPVLELAPNLEATAKSQLLAPDSDTPIPLRYSLAAGEKTGKRIRVQAAIPAMGMACISLHAIT
jgi:hypothetical protein